RGRWPPLRHSRRRGRRRAYARFRSQPPPPNLSERKAVLRHRRFYLEPAMPDVNEMRRGMLLGTAVAAASLAIPSMAAHAAQSNAGANRMSSNTITTKDGTQIYYKDWGSGQPIVFHHGWPLSADDWDAQMMFFLS